MGRKLTKSGIDIIGDLPWGSHFCSFYQTKQDLLDMLIPFIRAGLESKEFCFWVVSDPFDEDVVKEVAGGAIPNFDCYLENGQIEIVPYTGWYCWNDDYIDDYIQVMKDAVSRGFNGLRATVSMTWLEEKGWENFMEHEQIFNKMTDQIKMIALCSYYLPRCSARDVFDIVNSHQFAVFKKEDKWKVIETFQHKKTEQAPPDSEDKFGAIGKLASGTAHEINNQMTVIQACLDLYARDNSFDLACLKIRQAVERTTKLNRRLMLYSRAEDAYDEQLV
ncbi:MAG: MEDS domain-containing protein [Syntrophaceticus schinkii]